jgi:hypothetical protein
MAAVAFWDYEYEPGEAMGVPRRKVLLGLLAYAEMQTANVYEPLQTMIHSGPLADFVHVREGFIRLPNRGKIVPLSSAARSKLGQPLTGALGDESGLYTATNRVLDTWQTMRRGIAAMQGRTVGVDEPVGSGRELSGPAGVRVAAEGHLPVLPEAAGGSVVREQAGTAQDPRLRVRRFALG